MNPDGSYRQEIRRSPHFGGSGLFTSVEDLARRSRSLETHSLGGPELTALLLSTMKFQHDKTNDAFSLVWGNHRGHRTPWYEGGDLGFSSYMVRLPDDEVTVIVLSNLGTGRAADHARRVLDVLLKLARTRCTSQRVLAFRIARVILEACALPRRSPCLVQARRR